jgi:hypothetical protein
MTSRNRLMTFAAVLATAALPAAPALAKGGGGTPPPSDPAPYVDYCAQDPNGMLYTLEDGSTVFANYAGSAGCVWVRSYPAGYLRLDHVIVAPGWTYVVKSNGEGTNSRVQLEFTQPATGQKVDFRVEFGKTKVG